jgi:hypothetical protein
MIIVLIIIFFIIIFFVSVGVKILGFWGGLVGFIIAIVIIFNIGDPNSENLLINADISNISLNIIDSSNQTNQTSMKLSREYLYTFNFDLTNRTENDGIHVVSLEITINNINLINSTIFDSNSGNTSELVFYSSSGILSKTTTIQIFLPSTQDAFKSSFVYLKLSPLQEGEVKFTYDFISESVKLSSSQYINGVYTIQITK